LHFFVICAMVKTGGIKVNINCYRVPGRSYVEYYTDYKSNDLCLAHCGHEICNQGHKMPPHVRYHLLVHLVISGKGIYTCNNIDYTVKAGDIFIIYPNTVVSYKSTSEPPWHICWFAIKGNLADYYFPAKNKLYVQHIDNPREFEHSLYQLTDYLDDPGEANPFTVHSYLYSLLAHFYSYMTVFEEKPAKLYAERAVQFIKYNYFKPISSSDIAKYLDIDSAYFTKVFTKTIGINPQKYLIKFRIDAAAKMLRETNTHANSIAEMVGFVNVSHFFRTFHKLVGQTPNEYRLSVPK